MMYRFSVQAPNVRKNGILSIRPRSIKKDAEKITLTAKMMIGYVVKAVRKQGFLKKNHKMNALKIIEITDVVVWKRTSNGHKVSVMLA